MWCSPWGRSRTWLSNWTELTECMFMVGSKNPVLLNSWGPSSPNTRTLVHSVQSGSCSVLSLLFYPGSSFFLVSDHVWCQQNTWSVCLIFSHHIWGFMLYLCWASLVAQLVKNLLAMRETWVRSLGWKDPLEKGKATHSSILAWGIPWTV